MADDFNEGTRSGIDPCPSCHQPCIISSDVRAFGRKRVRYCLSCAAVYLNNERVSDIKLADSQQS